MSTAQTVPRVGSTSSGREPRLPPASAPAEDILCEQCERLINSMDGDQPSCDEGPSELWAKYNNTPLHHLRAWCTLCSLISPSVAKHFGSPSMEPDKCKLLLSQFHQSDKVAVRIAPGRDPVPLYQISGWDSLEVGSSVLAANAQLENSFIDFSAIRVRIQHCQATHTRCLGSHTPFTRRLQPIKLIDCHKRTILLAEPDALYLTLSYVWGNGEQDVSDFKSLQDRLPAQVPPLIEDALTITKRLGYQYLWIDRYCIDQSDDIEVAAQITQMDLIYRGAVCCIITAASENSWATLPGVLQPRVPRPHLDIATKRITVFRESPADEIEASRWNKRGWTYQEAIFSRRRLFVLKHRAIFECSMTGNVPLMLSTGWGINRYRGLSNDPQRFDSEDTERTLILDGKEVTEAAADDERHYTTQGSEFPPLYSSTTVTQGPAHRMDLIKSPVSEGDRILQDLEQAARDLEVFYLAWTYISFYNTRTLTYASDALLAIQGIFSSLQEEVESKRLGFEVFKGIPIMYTAPTLKMKPDSFERMATGYHHSFTEYLVHGLSWRSGGQDGGKRAGIPSWAWASRQCCTLPSHLCARNVWPNSHCVQEELYAEVQLCGALDSPRMDWEHFCEHHLPSCNESSLYDANSPNSPVLILHGSFFPVVLTSIGSHRTELEFLEFTSFDVYWEDDSQDDSDNDSNEDLDADKDANSDTDSNGGKRAYIEFGRQNSNQQELPELNSTCQCILAVPLWQYAVDPQSKYVFRDMTVLLLKGTEDEDTFERIGCAEVKYKEESSTVDMFDKLCNLRSRYRELAEKGLRLV